MDFLYQQLIAGKQKAVVGWLITALVAFLASQGITLPDNGSEVLTALLTGLLGYVGVYLTRNK
jgi:uncharacterized membrane protein (DUF441 family)